MTINYFGNILIIAIHVFRRSTIIYFVFDYYIIITLILCYNSNMFKLRNLHKLNTKMMFL